MNTSTKPYFIRAIHEWAEHNGFTPHVLVDALSDGVVVPDEHIKDGEILLNIAHSAIQLECMDNERIVFNARFNGVVINIELPIESIKGIYARENGQGLFFDVTHNPDSPIKNSHLEANNKKSIPSNIAGRGDKPRSHLKVIK